MMPAGSSALGASISSTKAINRRRVEGFTARILRLQRTVQDPFGPCINFVRTLDNA